MIRNCTISIRRSTFSILSTHEVCEPWLDDRCRNQPVSELKLGFRESAAHLNPGMMMLPDNHNKPPCTREKSPASISTSEQMAKGDDVQESVMSPQIPTSYWPCRTTDVVYSYLSAYQAHAVKVRYRSVIVSSSLQHIQVAYSFNTPRQHDERSDEVQGAGHWWRASWLLCLIGACARGN